MADTFETTTEEEKDILYVTSDKVTKHYKEVIVAEMAKLQALLDKFEK